MSETPVSPLEQEIAVEQRHVDRVYAQLGRDREAVTRLEKGGYGLAGAGVPGSLVDRDAMVFHAARRRSVLDAEHEGLVFGRLDLRDHKAPRYVGRIGVREEGMIGDDIEPLVVDWRAPAAEPFYRATAAEPLGVIRRRMIQSSGEKVTGIEDDLLDPEAASPGMTVIGDGALLAALSRARGTGMRDIVATIQQEQDVAIRAPGGGVTVVEGGPGTGKTAVALHRAAYLLYRDRARFAGGGVLIVGPSPVFVSYISAVLPSLGEESATLRSLGEMIDGVRATREEPAALHAIKGSLRMRKVLRRAAEDAVPHQPQGLRMRFRGDWLDLPARDVEQLRRQTVRGQRRNEIRGRAFGAILDTLWKQAQPNLPGWEQSRFDEEMTENEDFRTFLKRWWPYVRALDVLSWLADPRRLSWYASGILSAAEQNRLAGAIRLDDLSIDDIALLDELDELIGRPPRRKRRTNGGGYRVLGTRGGAQEKTVDRTDYRDYAHIIVDEYQDVTPMQWRMIGRRGELASWTIVGDPAQTAWTGDPGEPGRAREAATGRKERHQFALTTNYRNPAEIFEVAAAEIRRIAPDLPLPRAVRSTGVSPIALSVPRPELQSAVVSAATALLDEVDGTVGVITPDGRTRDEARRWLPEHGRLQVVTGLEAKGMEYDGVLVVSPSGLRNESGVRTLYVALSRATQRLTTIEISG